MVNKNVLREYIGGMGRGVELKHVPVELYSGVEFHFILAFAIDYTKGKPPSANNGFFQPFWNTAEINEGAIKNIKDKHHKVKFFLSLGGAKAYGPQQSNVDVIFTPNPKWAQNAFSSLVPIINKYHIDGIDIDYEDCKGTVETFAECIGELIERLKKFKNNIFFSIAPYGLKDWKSHQMYTKLWESYKYKIDYVNFQFYENDKLTSVDKYMKCYEEQCGFFDPEKIIASFSTGVGQAILADIAMEACEKLKKKNQLNGIFIWCADTSYNPNASSSRDHKFPRELAAHELLKGDYNVISVLIYFCFCKCFQN